MQHLGTTCYLRGILFLLLRCQCSAEPGCDLFHLSYLFHSREGSLCCSASLRGISILQFISLFVMSSLLAFSICLAQLLGFKMKWLIKQTDFFCTLYTKETDIWMFMFFILPILFLSAYVWCSLLKQKEKWLVKWNMNGFRKSKEKSQHLALEMN